MLALYSPPSPEFIKINFLHLTILYFTFIPLRQKRRQGLQTQSQYPGCLSLRQCFPRYRIALPIFLYFQFLNTEKTKAGTTASKIKGVQYVHENASKSNSFNSNVGVGVPLVLAYWPEMVDIVCVLFKVSYSKANSGVGVVRLKFPHKILV